MNLFSYPSFIARRYLWAKRKNGFISIISIISMAGVALGTAALIITLCIISGFENQLITKFINFDAHIRLKTFDGTEPIGDTNMIEEQLQGYKSIIGFSPYIEKEAMIRSSQITDGVIVKGINE
ncbi:MAG TPA: lipoprotein-releasing system transmembrane subunit LolC, partial [bacterium]|nr:lipoprotein-releasing system transmembrane subunit LolC [bacterium]